MQTFAWVVAVAAGLASSLITFRLLADANLLEFKKILSARGAVIGAVTIGLFLIAVAPTGIPEFGAANLAAAAVALVSAPLFLIDRHDQRLPNPITYSLIGIALFLAVETANFAGDWWRLWFALFWALIPFAFMLVMVAISRGGVGMGDAKLTAGLSLVAALTSGRLALTSLAAGFLLGGIYALGLLALKKGNRKTEFAFGPFLLAGFWVAYLFLR